MRMKAAPWRGGGQRRWIHGAGAGAGAGAGSLQCPCLAAENYELEVWRGSWRWQPPRAGSVPWWSNPGRRGTASRCAVGEVRWGAGVVRRRQARGAVQIRGEGRRGAARRARGEAAARHSEGRRGAVWRARGDRASRRREGELDAGGDSRGGEASDRLCGPGVGCVRPTRRGAGRRRRTNYCCIIGVEMYLKYVFRIFNR